MNKGFKIAIMIGFLLTAGTQSLFAQYKLSHQVIGSTGNFSKDASGNSISSTVGEPMITTVRDASGNVILTQGFQQPSSGVALQIVTTAVKTTCSISKDGYAVATVTGGKAPYTYSWSPLGGTDDTAKFLAPGIYTVMVTAANGFFKTDTVTITANTEVDCKLVIYSGFSPNGDGVNDSWVIDGISLFPENSVLIFNRWGDRVWGSKNYDNTNTVFDGRTTGGAKLTDGTYFYIIETSAEKYKGWVEITQ
jgi:gliding motility-associated-like protein